MAITLAQAKRLTYGKTLYHVIRKNIDGSAERWRVSGQPKTWKTMPERVSVPVKHGIYDNDHLTENELHLVSLTDPNRANKKKKSKSGFSEFR